MSKPVRVKFTKTYEGIGAGETRIFDPDTAQSLIAIGVAIEMWEIKPAGPKEIKPVQPSEIKQEFSGKKKVKTPKS